MEEVLRCQTVPEYFAKGGTINSYRHDMVKGNFTFKDSHLWNLQYARAADWRALSSGGENSSLELHYYSIQAPWVDPQEAIRIGIHGSCNALINQHLHDKDPSFTEPSQAFLKQWLQDKDAAYTLGMTHTQYNSAKYQPESLIKSDGSRPLVPTLEPVERPPGSSCSCRHPQGDTVVPN